MDCLKMHWAPEWSSCTMLSWGDSWSKREKKRKGNNKWEIIGEEADTKVRRRGRHERKTWGEEGQGEGRGVPKQREEETLECIKVCVNTRVAGYFWGDIFGTRVILGVTGEESGLMDVKSNPLWVPRGCSHLGTDSVYLQALISCSRIQMQGRKTEYPAHSSQPFPSLVKLLKTSTQGAVFEECSAHCWQTV